MIKIIECPRDAIQGLHQFVPTEIKASYINNLLKVGFDTIDFGSFVSPRSIPQMRDTADVIKLLDLTGSATKLLAIVANTRGAEDASRFDEISVLGYPFSISETFQQRNANSTIEQSLLRLKEIYNIAFKSGKELVAYLSMGFGNPYGDEWNTEIIANYTDKLFKMGIQTISLSDTVGIANPDIIEKVSSELSKEFPSIEFGAHLHTRPDNWLEKLDAAYKGGIRRFDSAIRGFGGCPMAQDELVGNMATENLITFFESQQIDLSINKQRFKEAALQSSGVYI